MSYRATPSPPQLPQHSDRCSVGAPDAESLAGDDTAQIMTALGRQLCEDFQGGIRLFSTLMMCGEPHPQPCEPGQVDAARSTVPRVIDIASRAAAGRLCHPRSCDMTGAIVELSLGAPSLFADSAVVGVMAFRRADQTENTKYFTRYRYRLHRVSRYTWAVTARFSTGGGHYGFPP